MNTTVVLSGAGALPFARPGPGNPYAEMGRRAIGAALDDAGLDFDLAEQAVVAFAYADSGAGQRALSDVGMTGIPVTNVNNRCASGGTAFYLACEAVRSGAVECAVALGFDEFLAAPPGAVTFPDLADPIERYRMKLAAVSKLPASSDRSVDPFANDLYALLLDHMRRDQGIPEMVFARIAEKARSYAGYNENALRRNPLQLADLLAEVAAGKAVPTAYASFAASGAAAAVVCSRRFAQRYGLRSDIEVLSSVLETPVAADLETVEIPDLLGRSLTRRTAGAAYEAAGLGPAAVDVAEVHDYCVAGEAMSYAALGFCAEDEVPGFVLDGASDLGGRLPVGTSGGMLGRGHAPGATGLAQIAELKLQLSGKAGARQVDQARTALAHNLAVGAAAVVSILQRSGRTI